MSKGKRTTTNGFAKDIFTAQDGTPEARPASGFVAKAPENEPINTKLSKKVVVGTGTSPEDIVRLDTEGVILMFEQKDDFLPLGEEIVAKLSRINKLNYQLAKDFHDAWRGNEHSEFVEKFKVDKQMMGSASDKLKIDAGKGMHVRWVAPYNVENMIGKGYKVLSADEAKSFLGSVGGHHEVGKLGHTELVAMGVPEEIYQGRLREKTQRNLERAGAWKAAGLAEIDRQGGNAFDATKDDRRDWAEIQQPAEE